MDFFSYQMGTGKPSGFGGFVDVMVWLLPIWTSIAAGLIVGWSWKPTWANFALTALRDRKRFLWSTPPGFGARRLWLALTALAAWPAIRLVWVSFQAWRENLNKVEAQAAPQALQAPEQQGPGSSSLTCVLTDGDLTELKQYIDGTDSGPAWELLMSKEGDGMQYTAWRRDPEEGPTQYRSQTIMENCTTEQVRDFFWDDGFRISSQWDDMLTTYEYLEECPQTGSQMVRWVRRFPFFCKPREYVFGRRIWTTGNGTFYCISKGKEHVKAPPQDKPRRVPTFYSSWLIERAPALDGSGAITSVKVTLFHWEDMGIPKHVAKLGVRQGMWGAVKKMGPGIRQYIAQRESGVPLSHAAQLARVVSLDRSAVYQRSVSMGALEGLERSASVARGDTALRGEGSPKKQLRRSLSFAMAAGGVALAVGMDRGALGKLVVAGVVKHVVCKNKRRASVH